MIDIFRFINDELIWGWPLIVGLLVTGILLTIRTKFLQVRKFGYSVKKTVVHTLKQVKKQDKKSEKKDEISVSPFQAFATAISGTVGTGNIIGVTSAILTGGPGAVFWMWISALFGMVTKYSENVLGLYYRVKDKNGNLSGGPFYYIKNGLKLKWLAYLAAVFCLLAAITMSGVQSNKISETIAGSVGMAISGDNSFIIKLIVGIVVAVLTALIIIGGIKRIGKISSILVPFMSLLFIAVGVVTIAMHITAIPSVFALIFKSAFNFQAAGAGILGYAFITVLRKGVSRGIFSNEAGLGSSLIASSASSEREPVRQGLWGIIEVFFDTFVICTITALMFLLTFDLSSFTGAESDAVVAMSIFSTNFGSVGTVIFSICLPLFAFTTILAWVYYGEKAVEFCFSKSKEKTKSIAVLIFKIIYVAFIVVASVVSSDVVWLFSDMCNGLMAFPNLICLLALSGMVVKITKNYFARKKGLDVKPMLSAYTDLNEEFIKETQKD